MEQLSETWVEDLEKSAETFLSELDAATVHVLKKRLNRDDHDVVLLLERALENCSFQVENIVKMIRALISEEDIRPPKRLKVLQPKESGFLQSLPLDKTAEHTSSNAIDGGNYCLLDLPNELGTHIMSFLDLQERIRARTVCSTFLSWVDGSLASLPILDLHDRGITDDLLHWFGKRCVHLSELNISDCGSISSEGFLSLLARNKSLLVLNLSYTNLSGDVVLPTIASSCSQLKTLKVGFCDSVTDVGLEEILKGCPVLESLDISCSDVTDGFILKLAKLARNNLQYLNMSHCALLTDLSVHAIALTCTQLRTLDITGCLLVSDVGLRTLRRRGVLTSSTTAVVWRVAEDEESQDTTYVAPV